MDVGGITRLLLPCNGSGFLGFKAMGSVAGGVAVQSRRSFPTQLLEWGNSFYVTMFWAILGCICNLCCPMFLYLDEGQSAGDIGPVRLMIMLISCASTAGVYRLGFVLRQQRIMRDRPPLSGHLMGNAIFSIIYVAITVGLMDGGTWATVVGLELLAVSVFGLMEMAKPVYDFNMLQFFLCLPIITGARRYGWEFVYLGWPMLTVVLTVVFINWNAFFLRITSPVSA